MVQSTQGSITFLILVMIKEGIKLNVLRNRFVIYMFTLIISSFIIYMGLYYEAILFEVGQATFTMVPVILFQSIFAFILGTVFAIPHFAMTFQEDGKMTFDWLKFSLFGIPSLIVTVFPVLFYTELLNSFNLNMLLPIVNEKIHFISGIVFGYTLFSSWYKMKLKLTIS